MDDQGSDIVSGEDRPQGVRFRLRTAGRDKKKALEHYQELRRDGKVERALVIAEDKDGTITVLGQMLTPNEIAELMLWAARGLEHLMERHNEPRREAHETPAVPGEVVGITNPSRAITTGEDGTLVPPPGEHFISCGECNHPRFYVTDPIAEDGVPARLSCGHCGNEIIIHRVYHEEGRA